jgi:DNA-binding MarR family transcriptional regulator
MEEKELNIIEAIHNNPQTNQRKISKETGLSLGLVNLLIKKLVHKGFVKIESLNKKTIKYIITPKGIKEKSKKTIEYIKKSYNKILIIKNNILRIIEQNSNTHIYLLGEKDEIYQITTLILKDENIKYTHIKTPQEITTTNNTILYWNTEIKNNKNYYNIFENAG